MSLAGVAGQGLSTWFDTPPGRYLLQWERARFDAAVADLFGYHAVQLGLPELETLRANRMPNRWLALPEPADAHEHPALDGRPGCDLVTHAAALPFAAASVDLLTLPHTLEFSADARTVLREVERVLVPQGRVVISGLNPNSLWGWRQQRANLAQRLGLAAGESGQFLPEAGDLVGSWRLRDWLRLLGLEVESQTWGCYRPAVRSDKWLQRYAWMDRAGSRAWPIFGAVYFLVAVKRVRGMHLLGPAWKPRRAATAPVPVAQKNDISSP